MPVRSSRTVTSCAFNEQFDMADQRARSETLANLIDVINKLLQNSRLNVALRTSFHVQTDNTFVSHSMYNIALHGIAKNSHKETHVIPTTFSKYQHNSAIRIAVFPIACRHETLLQPNHTDAFNKFLQNSR